MTTFEYENASKKHIKRFVDGEFDGRYIPVDRLSEFPEYEAALLADEIADETIPVEALEASAKDTRDEAIDAPIEAHGVLWDIDSTSRDRMTTAIRAAGRNPARSTVNWVLADNSIRETTAEELEQVLDAYAMRMEETFVAHTMWRMGDKKTKFKL